MKEFNTFSSVLLVLIWFCLVDLVFPQNYIAVHVISSGGEQQTGSNYSLGGTVGQIGTNIMTSSGYILLPGFWNMYNSDIAVDAGNEYILPLTYSLEQNYPNPFNPSTIIEFSVPEKCFVKIVVHDIIGRTISSIVNEELDAGNYRRVFNAGEFSSGVYIYRMETGEYKSTRKMLLLK